jgi:folate-dependent tRNA-U54 methylase TrmFO/GidA
MYALSGMLLKRWSMTEIKEFEGGRQFPTVMTIEDVAKEGTKTVLTFTDLTFGVELEGDVFSMRWLERG